MSGTMINTMRIALLLFALALLGCGTGGTGSFGTKQAEVDFATADANYDSTDDLRFEIEQTSHPMIFGASQGRTDVSFRITITNKTKVPMIVKRLTLQSIGGSIYRVDSQSRKFNTKIAPDARESFKFWATAIATDTRMETYPPLVQRATVDGLEGDASMHAVFNRRVNRSDEHTSEHQSRGHLVCRLLL